MEAEKRYEVVERLLFEVHEPKIRAYINQKINKPGASKNLHLVFQSTGENNLFSYQIFKLVEDCIFKKRYESRYELFTNAAESIAQILFDKNLRIRKYVMTLELGQKLFMQH